MIVELYEAPASDSSDTIDSPISKTTGELPVEEPTLDLGELLGSFDSQEEAIAFLKNQIASQNQLVTDNRVASFDQYTHVGWLTVAIQQEDNSIKNKNYYLVTDEGY